MDNKIKAEIYLLLDKMQLTKGRQPFDDTIKAVWIDEFDGMDIRGIREAIRVIIRSGSQENAWPTVGRIIDEYYNTRNDWNVIDNTKVLLEMIEEEKERERLKNASRIENQSA